MLNNAQNNTKDAVNVNTKSIQMMNRDGFMQSTLVLGFWNDLVSLKIHPALEKGKQTETRFYDYDQWINTALTADKVQCLITGIENRILPAIKNDEDKNISVIVNKDCLVLISTGKKETGSIKPYIGIFKGIDPTTKKPSSYLCYEFKSAKMVVDYDANTGECATEDDNISEFLLFYSFLKSYVAANSNAVVHTTRYVNKYFKDKLMANLSSVMSKLGVENPTSYGDRKGSYKQNVFTGGGTSSAISTNVVVEEVDDLESYMN